MQSMVILFNKKRRLQKKIKNINDVDVKLYSSMKKMYKNLSNSLYGNLNYKYSVLYAPTVSAAIVLLARKTFHETVWLYENEISDILNDSVCKTIYLDTDGAIFACDRYIENEKQCIQFVNDIIDRIVTNDNFFRNEKLSSSLITVKEIHLESEYEKSRLCTIMGKKKYWRMCNNRNIETRGFEKNAQPFVKSLVNKLQCNVSKITQFAIELMLRDCGKEIIGFCSILQDPLNFFLSIYDELEAYYQNHGLSSFVFTIPLNPKKFKNDTAENSFIRNVLSRYDYNIGDRVKCLFVLDNDQSFDSSVYKLLRDFNHSTDRLNYYKFIRRLAIYFLQLVEGFKRQENLSSNNYINASQFDNILKQSFDIWIREKLLHNNQQDRLYSILFHDDSSIENTNNSLAHIYGTFLQYITIETF